MVEIVSDLVGKIVEIRERYSDSAPRLLKARGTVRAVGVDQRGVFVVLEHLDDFTNPWGGDICGGLETFHINDDAVRQVVQCRFCCTWQHPSKCDARVYPGIDLVSYVCDASSCQDAKERP